MKNKNDCCDCVHCVAKNIYDKNSDWYCNVTGTPLGKLWELDGFEDECEYFEYVN